MNNKKITLCENSKKLLNAVTRELLVALGEDKKISNIKEGAFEHIINDNEEVQVQILITRDREEFLESFQKVATTNMSTEQFEDWKNGR